MKCFACPAAPPIAQKLHNERGETLAELLAAILVAALSVTLLFSGIAAAGRINLQAQKADETYYAALNNAQARKGDTRQAQLEIQLWTGSAKPNATQMGREEPTINLYGGPGLYSYKWAEGGA